MGHQDGTLGQTIEDREGGDKGMLQQNKDGRGDHRRGMKIGETGELQVKLSGETQCSRHREVQEQLAIPFLRLATT